MSDQQEKKLQRYQVWDLPVRSFHWINVLCVLGLVGVGLVVMNLRNLGVSSDGAYLLKQIHVYIGYVFVANLFFRLLWAFIGSPASRWRALLPIGKGFFSNLTKQLRNMKSGRPNPYIGHSPTGRISVTILLCLLLVQAVTGLVLAGTDIYYPPFGHFFASWVAAPGVNPADVIPYVPELVHRPAFDEVRQFRKPFIILHQYAFYSLLVMIALHIGAVFLTELRGSSIISAMITGKKHLTREPEDRDLFEQADREKK